MKKSGAPFVAEAAGQTRSVALQVHNHKHLVVFAEICA
jgi:hypothetical protein